MTRPSAKVAAAAADAEAEAEAEAEAKAEAEAETAETMPVSQRQQGRPGQQGGGQGLNLRPN